MTDDFQKRLMETFRVEAREHVTAMASCIEELSSGASDPEGVLEQVFREAHSLKGAARAVDLRGIERICQELESRFAVHRKAGSFPAGAELPALHAAVDALAELLEAEHPQPGTVDGIVALLQAGAEVAPLAEPKQEASAPETSRPTVVNPEPETVEADGVQPKKIDTTRTATAELDQLFRRTEELFSNCLVQESALGRVAELRDSIALARTGLKRRNGTGGNAGSVHDVLQDHLAALELVESECNRIFRDWSDNYRSLRRGVSGLLEGVKRLQMLPLRAIYEPLPRLVRGLARDCGKNVRIDLRGEDIRIDKHVLENLSDPLVHLIRNCVDHGIESPDERARAGKPETAVITVSARPIDARTMALEISDDGRGIDTAALRDRAVKAGIMNRDDADSLSEEEATALVFHSGLSTSRIITDLSGRGLGLAIVQEKVVALEGAVTCESQLGVGTVFCLRLPLTITTTRVIEVHARGTRYLIPAGFVAQAKRISAEGIGSVAGCPTTRVNGRAVNVAHLGDVLGLPLPPSHESNGAFTSALLLRAGKDEAMLTVDLVGAEREVIAKPLGSQLLRVRHVSGGTLEAGGKVVLVLNAADIVGAIRAGVAPAGGATKPAVTETARVLVVDDSVTSRTLLRDILSASGFQVDTAVDGMEAFTKLRELDFDLVVSDVDMPRLNGFELVRKVRQDKKVGEIPVILVTSLDSREDRERGIDVGANAYIVKSSFDQSNLLEVARRFV